MDSLCERATAYSEASHRYGPWRGSSSVWRLCRRGAADLCLCLCMLIPVGAFLWFMPLLAGMLSDLQTAGAVPARVAAPEAPVGALEPARKGTQLPAVDAPEPALIPAGMEEDGRSAFRQDAGQRW